MNVVIIDGQGGLLGAQLVKEIISRFKDINLTAIGTNAVVAAAMFTFMGLNGGNFTFPAFIAGAFTDAIPGIIIQIILIPSIVMILDNTKISKLR